MQLFEGLLKQNYKIFIDTSSLMDRDADFVFFKLIAPLLVKYKQQLIVPKSVLNEISKHNYNSHKSIEMANRILSELAKYNLYGTNLKFNESFADNTLISQFSDLRLKYNLCLITNDKKLSLDILNLKNSHSTYGIKDIKVFYIKKKTLFEFKDSPKQMSNTNTKYVKPDVNKFKTPLNPNENDVLVPNRKIPIAGDYIIDHKGRKHRLLKQIGRTGGEGSVYIIDNNYVCKIYKKEKITKFRFEKIKLLIQNKINIKNIALPKYIAFNEYKEFVGYIMPKAEGSEIKTSIFIVPLLKQKFPHWNRIHLAKIALNIVNKIQELHKYNIILGDINPFNILLKDENNISFIDTDSFQIEGYPCPVGMVPYTKPINHGRKQPSLKTKQDDIFATSVLIFQLMLPGKLPYSFSGGGSEKENMKPENFPYRCYDGKGYDNAPEGQWVFMWSHLPKKLKELFCRIFKKDDNISLKDLAVELDNYIYQLEQGHQTQAIFPSTYKQIDRKGNVLTKQNTTLSKPNQINCSKCGKIFHSKKFNVCDECHKKQTLRKCIKCGVAFKNNKFNICNKCYKKPEPNKPVNLMTPKKQSFWSSLFSSI